MLVFLLLISSSLDSLAEDKGEEPGLQGEAFDKQSLALRTALHYDPSLDAPLKGLIRLYQKAGRLEDLLGLYRAHTTQYGEDVGAKVVMIRLLKELDRVEVGEMIQAAAQQHPEHPELKHLLYQDYKRRGDKRALKTLSEAIDLQKRQGRRHAWMEELLAQAQESDARGLAEGHLKENLSVEGHTATTLLALATQMHRYHFDEMCLAALSQAQAKKPDAETGVEIDLMAARAEASLGQFDAVARRMDALLKRLAPNYHRRREIMKLRVGLVKTAADREKLLVQAKERYEKEPMNEGVALDYAELLSANEMRRKAAEVLVEASHRLVQSERLEKEALRLLDRIGDEKGMQSFLEERLKNDPRREDLEYRLVKVEYLAGKAVAARQRLDKVTEKLEAEERARRLLDLARYLRQMSQPVESADLLAEVVELLPARLDVQRELLETLLALERRGKAEKLLANLSVEDAEIENFVDLVQFMVQADFLVEAREALENRLKSEGERFDLNLLLVSVLGKTGDRKEAEEILMKARNAADTTARYAQWLDAGLALYDLLESPEQFFDAEQFRFLEEGGEWMADRVERFLTLCETGERKRLGDRVAQALRNQLVDVSLPDPLKLRLRMLLVKALDKSPDNAGEVEDQLKLLAEEDGNHADEYQLRRALLYHSNSRPDLAQDLLTTIDVEKVADESILRAAYLVFLEYLLADSAKICLKKLTTLEPTDTGGWEKRLSLLAALGEEEELRVVLRRLLVGIDRMILKSETRQALRTHLLDSYWRSISRLLEKDDEEALGEALMMLDSVDRDAGRARDRAWSLWTRAFVLNRLERAAARDEVIKELGIFLKKESDFEGEKKEGQSMIAFPDGLAVSMEAAVELLRSKVEEHKGEVRSVEDSEGPLGAIEMVWAFEVDPGARVLQITPAGEKAMLALDDQGGVYNIDAENGKLLWHEQYRVPSENGRTASRNSRNTGGITISNSYFQVHQQGQSIMVQQLSAPYRSAQLGPTAGRSSTHFTPGVKKVRSMLVDGDSGFFLSVGNQIRSFRSKDGSMLWQSELAPVGGMTLATVRGSPSISRPDPVMFLEGDHLLCYAPSLDVAVCFQKQTGKLIWSRKLEAAGATKGMVFSLNSGAAFSDGRLFVFGQSCEILDSATGKTLWSFDDRGVHRFPVALDRVQDDDEKVEKSEVRASTLSLPTVGSINPVTGSALKTATTFLGHDDDVVSRMKQLKLFLLGEGALVAPAVQWNGMRMGGKVVSDARIFEDRLLLLGSNNIREISLNVPVGSRRYPVRGVLIGTAGDQVWFLEETFLTKLSLSDGSIETVQVGVQAEGSTPMHAVISGSRIYVSHRRGLTVLNAHSGRLIGGSKWPKQMVDYLTKQRAGNGANAERREAVWQGFIRSIPGLPVYCFPLRDQVHGDRLFTMVGDTGFAMLRGRRTTPPKK